MVMIKKNEYNDANDGDDDNGDDDDNHNDPKLASWTILSINCCLV